MTNNKKLISLIFLILIVLMGITVWLVLYSLDNNRITPFPDGTEVGYVYIGGKNTWQAESALRSEINKWKEADHLKIELSYQDRAYTLNIDPTIFDFNISKSIQNVKENEKMNYDKGINVIDVSFKDENKDDIKTLISDNLDNLKFNDFDIDLIEEEVLKQVSFLFKEIYIDIGIAVNEEIAMNTAVGTPITLTYNKAEFLSNRINRLVSEPFLIKAQEQFSLNDFLINIYNQERNQIEETRVENVNIIYNKYFSEEELNVIASGIYQIALNTNFINIGKHISQKLPSFVSSAGLEAKTEIGYDFTIEQRFDDENNPYNAITKVEFINEKDLTFFNPNYNDYYIKVTHGKNQNEQNVLIFQLYGTPFINTYSTDFQVNEEITQGTITWKTNDSNIVAPGERLPYDPGYPGHLSIVVREIVLAYPKENELKEYRKRMTEDIYSPKDAIFIEYEETSNG